MSSCLETTVHVLRQHLRVPSIGAELELERDLGVDPFDLVLIVAELEEALQVRVRYEELAALRTVSDVARLLQDGAPASRRAARTDSGCLAILRERSAS
jgi:acyl carrier protein